MRFQIRHLYWILTGPTFAVQRRNISNSKKLASAGDTPATAETTTTAGGQQHPGCQQQRGREKG